MNKKPQLRQLNISEAIMLLVNATYSDEWQGNEDLETAKQMAISALQYFRDNKKSPLE